MRHLCDVVIACALIVLTFPLLAIVSLAIKCESPGPLFYRQERVGFGGRRFRSLQFRTMAYDAEHASRRWAQDSKITGLGPFLRYTRIDRLPQLINVLRREMTVISRASGRPHFLD